MSNPVVDNLICDCCSIEQPSNCGIMQSNMFICFICRKSHKINLQNNWLSKISDQQVIIDNAITALQSLDVLDKPNVSAQLKLIVDAVSILQNYANN